MTAATPASDTESIDAFLRAYCPSVLPQDKWLPLAVEANELVKRAGDLTHDRVKKDISTLAAVAAFVYWRNRPLTLTELLADAAYDAQRERNGVQGATRANERGRVRRMQAVFNDVPWRRERRVDGERITKLPPLELIANLATVEAAAHADVSDSTSNDFLAVVAQARRAIHRRQLAVDNTTWDGARRFAALNGWVMTRGSLAHAILHELLGSEEPFAVAAARAALTRRSADLGLVHAESLPEQWSPAHRRALRGA